MTEGPLPPISSGTLPYARRLEEYLDTASRLFPGMGRDELDSAPLPQADALISALFLECLPQEVELLQAGTLSGLCAFYFAGAPGVRRVVCAGPDQKIGKSGPGALEAARSVLAEFPAEQERVRLHEDSSAELPATDDVLPVVLLAGQHTREGVRAELESLCARDPHALFLVSGCRGEDGPFVQAGVVDFIEGSARGYRFRLFRDLGPGLASSGLGLLFGGNALEIGEKALSELASAFSGRLDPLRLLEREEELIEKANRFREELHSIKSSRSWRLLEGLGRLWGLLRGVGRVIRRFIGPRSQAP